MESKPTKQFSWSSNSDAKPEYDEWLASLTASCNQAKVGFCVNENFAPYFIPVEPLPPVGNSTSSHADYRKDQMEYKKALRVYWGQYQVASGYLKNSLVYNTKARSEIDAILDRPPPHPLDDQGNAVVGWEYTPDKAFKAAMKRLKDVYAPSDATDCATYRQKIAELNDNDEGGFKYYAEKFTTYHSALVRAGQEPSATDCTTWVLKGIQNPNVKGVISALIATKDPNLPLPTFREIFRYLEAYLKNMGESDPYKSTKISASGNVKVAVNAITTPRNENRCTKCWRQGHGWKACTAKACSGCGKPFQNAKYCTSWESHQDSNTRWAPRHLIEGNMNGNKKKRPNEDMDDVDKEKTNKSDTTLEALKNAKKIYMAARKEFNRAK